MKKQNTIGFPRLSSSIIETIGLTNSSFDEKETKAKSIKCKDYEICDSITDVNLYTKHALDL